MADAWIARAVWQASSADERDWSAYRLTWFAGHRCAGSEGWKLERTLPYLIAALATEEGLGPPPSRSSSLAAERIRGALAALTGQTFGSVEQWWGWWQARTTGS